MSEDRNITFLCGQCCASFGDGEQYTLGWFHNQCEICKTECNIKDRCNAGFVRTTEKIRLRISLTKAFDDFYQEKIKEICSELGINEFTARMIKPELSFTPHLPPANHDQPR